MRSSLLIVAALLTSVPSFADVYDCRDGCHFSLLHHSLTAWTDSELSVSSKGVIAPGGVRREGRKDGFQTHEVVVVGEAYDLKDSAGNSWRMWIHASRTQFQVELVRANQPAATSPVVYRAAAITINGAEAQPTFADLELSPDGGYRLSTARGHYERDEHGISLDGAAGQWGLGVVSDKDQTITFSYTRGPFRWEVKYARVDPAAVNAVALSR